jgi:predicted nucleic acid-binding protein
VSAFVLDCSVAMAWCFEDEARPESDQLLERVRDDGAIVPGLWFWEVANVLGVAVRRRRISEGDVVSRLDLLSALPIRVDEEGVAKAWRETRMLAKAEGLSVYDAAYLELAGRVGAELATNDADLRAAALRLGVGVLPRP